MSETAKRRTGKTAEDEAALTYVTLVSGNARGVWYALMGLLTFSAVSLLSIRDADFFSPGADTALPLLGVSIPTDSFFWSAPFVILALSGLTPLPFWPFKVMAHVSSYPTGSYLLANAIGRMPRYLLLAAFGKALPSSTWGVVIFSLAFGAWSLLFAEPKERNDDEQSNEDHQELHG